ncbi:MAG TPA: nucleotidyltransferase family protein [Vicinamibacterales bacterium]|nr:nucleotidyltransferase family protein [Vicinamibacterales bacterium]
MSLALVPAAGKAERFGSVKLLVDLDGEPLIARTIRSLLDAGVAHVVVIVAPGSPLLDPGILPAGAPVVTTVVNPDPARGMFSSIQAGCAVAEGEPLLVLPADMPFVRPATIAAVLAAAADGDAVVLPTFRGKHGHPIGLPGSACDAILAADPRSNLKAVLAATGPPHVELDVDDPGVLRDVDVPSDLKDPRRL